jgi:serine/threonine-protein kinase
MQRRGDGKFFLIDFGAVKEIASLTVNSQGQTSVTVAIGTPGYMPSEQAAGNPKPSSDIYALGMVIIELITGIRADQLPKDSHSGEVCWQHLVNLSLPLAEVLEKMVRYDYRQRYASAIEVLEAIKNLDNMTVPTMPSSASPSQRTKIQGFHPILLVKRALRGEPPAIVNLLLMIVATTAAVLAVPQVQKWLPQEPIPRVQATEFKAYQNAEYQLKLNYPTSWEMDSKRNSITHTIVTFQIPEAELIVSVEDLSSQPKTFGQYTDNFMDQLAADIPNFAH